MLRQKKKVFFLLLFLFSNIFAATSRSAASSAREEKQLLEELTGHKNPKLHRASQKSSAATLHLSLGMSAKKKRDFKTALQHFNSAIARQSKSSELKKAYLEKAQLYRLMNLPEQAKYNEQLAEKVKSTDVH